MRQVVDRLYYVPGSGPKNRVSWSGSAAGWMSRAAGTNRSSTSPFCPPSPEAGRCHDRNDHRRARTPPCLRSASDPVEGILHRIYVVFEEYDGRLWASGTDMMAPSLKTAEIVRRPAQRDAWPRQELPGRPLPPVFSRWAEAPRHLIPTDLAVARYADRSPPRVPDDPARSPPQLVR